MNTTKKIAVALVVIVMMIALVACGGKAPEELAGKWELVGAQASGQQISVAQLKEAGIEMSFDFVSGNKVKVHAIADGTTTDGSATYKFEDNTVTAKDLSGTVVLKLVDNQLQLDQAGVTLLFERA